MGLEILTLIRLIDWRTIFDVPIIALGIFFLYRTLRSSGAWRIVLGIFIVLSVYIIAQAFRLTGITWIFSNLSNIALIALIIIFQPEIRKIFERAASTLRVRDIGKEVHLISEIIAEAVFSLAEKSWGALLVLPGKETVRSRLSGGIAINAEPSLPLILSLFDPHSTGHDGALMIENGKITDFALRLPLSTSGRLGNGFGTRHHAAMGLCELSDAMVIAVSEERGEVSIFSDGEHRVAADRVALVSRIEEHYRKISSYAPVQGKLKNRGVLIAEIAASTVIAFFIWAAIMLNATQLKEMSFAVPVEYMLSNSDMVITGEKPTAVRVRVSGTTSSLTLIKPDDLKAKIDLSEATPGKQFITITRDNIRLPKEVALIDTEPSAFEINLQSYVEKELLIKPQLIGKLPRRLELAGFDINPRKLKILYSSGEKEPGDAYLTTTPIYLQNITENTRILCNLIAPPNIYPIDRQWPDIVVTIMVKR